MDRGSSILMITPKALHPIDDLDYKCQETNLKENSPTFNAL